MTAPSKFIRDSTKARDGHRCISCSTTQNLSFQHRQASGMGGSKKPLTPAAGLTACVTCNMRFESDLQGKALAYGWKVARWVTDPADVPVFDPLTDTWFLLAPGWERVPLLEADALELMSVVTPTRTGRSTS